LKGIYHLGDVGIDAGIILKWIFKEGRFEVLE
jgi:hypothetical protein